MTDLQFEAEMVQTVFHMPFYLWLKNVPKLARFFEMAVYRRRLDRENYHNTPKDEQFTYYSRG